jgi:Ser/Thr protein kinase RdoA (MazF antagonist)
VPKANPFAVIETEAPQLPESEILQLLKEQYGLEPRLDSLVSERDQNLRLRCDDGRQFVLKIANAAEEPLATDFQVQALLHLEAYLASNDCPINVPRILRTVDGSASLVVTFRWVIRRRHRSCVVASVSTWRTWEGRFTGSIIRVVTMD